VRDDFDLKTKEILAKRVGYRCSNPGCRKLTSGPRSDPAPTPPPAQPRPQSARCPNHHQTTPGSVDPRTLAPIPSLRPLRRAGRLLHSERTAPDRISHVERHELRLHRAAWAARSPAPAAPCTTRGGPISSAEPLPQPRCRNSQDCPGCASNWQESHRTARQLAGRIRAGRSMSGNRSSLPTTLGRGTAPEGKLPPDFLRVAREGICIKSRKAYTMSVAWLSTSRDYDQGSGSRPDSIFLTQAGPPPRLGRCSWVHCIALSWRAS